MMLSPLAIVSICLVLIARAQGELTVPIANIQVDKSLPALPEAPVDRSAIPSFFDSLPPVFKNIFEQVQSTVNQKLGEMKREGVQSEEAKPKKHFILTLLVMKKPQEDVREDEQKPNMVLFKVNGSEKKHLLGEGDDDVDKKFAAKDQNVGNPDVFEQKPNALISSLLRPQFPESMFHVFKNGKAPYQVPDSERDRFESPLIIRTHNGDFLEDMGQREEHYSSSHFVKKCMMQHFMRLKASLYYRVILNMLFISGIMLFTLLVAMLVLRSCRRRQAMRHNPMNVSAIDAKLALANSPPAYEQIISEKKNLSDTSAVRSVGQSSLVNSLAQAYRNRYSQIKPSEDAVSVSSLPKYEEHAKKMHTQDI